MLCLLDIIRDDDPAVQRLLRALDDARSLTALILAAWQGARVLAVRMVEAVLAERARRPTAWPACPACGTSLQSKGFAPRQVPSVRGRIRWRRRVGRCPQGGPVPQSVPFEEALGVQPEQRTSAELQHLGCALAVVVPCATAAPLLSWASGGAVSPRAVWMGVQTAGLRAMEQLHTPLQAAAAGEVPPGEPLVAEVAALPLA